MSPRITDHLAQSKMARITGGCYLGFILASVLADRLGHIGLGDAQQIYQSVVTDPTSFRLALVVAFVSAFLFLVTAWGLYVLLRPVNKDLALLFLLLNTVGVAIQCASMLPLLSALLMGDAGQPHAGLLGGAAGGAGVPVRQRVQDGLRHGPAVLRHVAVPARLPGLQVQIPSPALGVLLIARRRRRPHLVPPGPAAAGPPRDHLPRARRELHRRSRAGVVAPRQGREGPRLGNTPPDRPEPRELSRHRPTKEHPWRR